MHIFLLIYLNQKLMILNFLTNLNHVSITLIIFHVLKLLNQLFYTFFHFFYLYIILYVFMQFIIIIMSYYHNVFQLI